MKSNLVSFRALKIADILVRMLDEVFVLTDYLTTDSKEIRVKVKYRSTSTRRRVTYEVVLDLDTLDLVKVEIFEINRKLLLTEEDLIC